MVTKVYGTVDGVEVIFTPSGGSTWTCKVPRDLDGEYIVDLHAVNDAGITTYFATVLFAVRGVDVSVTWLTVDTAASMSGYDVMARLLSNTRPRKKPGA